MSEQLLHYSCEPLDLAALDDETGEQAASHKPVGLWVSVGDAWKEWCESEGFGLDRLRCVAEVVLDPAARIIRVEGAEAIDEFTREYGDPASDSYRWGIDWRRAAADGDGIVISPYVWERRYEDSTAWYYTWDCASGCVWNPAAVASALPLPPDSAILSGTTTNPTR